MYYTTILQYGYTTIYAILYMYSIIYIYIYMYVCIYIYIYMHVYNIHVCMVYMRN